MYLLRNSLKTLVRCYLSPLAAHLNESLTSLRFATKVRARSLHSVFFKIIPRVLCIFRR
ncbi:hypothetical protein FB451DRAFT_1309043, partial [Mycena latifolia]